MSIATNIEIHHPVSCECLIGEMRRFDPPLSEGNSIVSEAYVIAHVYVHSLRITVCSRECEYVVNRRYTAIVGEIFGLSRLRGWRGDKYLCTYSMCNDLSIVGN